MARILVVDDAEFMQVTLSTILRKADHEIVAQAKDGKKAIELYKKFHPDLVTMDITMPIMNGIDASKAILAYDKNAKIVICSSMGQQKIVVDAIEAGIKDFIVKPFDEFKIADTVHRVLGEAETAGIHK